MLEYPTSAFHELPSERQVGEEHRIKVPKVVKASYARSLLDIIFI